MAIEKKNYRTMYGALFKLRHAIKQINMYENECRNFLNL